MLLDQLAFLSDLETFFRSSLFDHVAIMASGSYSLGFIRVELLILELLWLPVVSDRLELCRSGKVSEFLQDAGDLIFGPHDHPCGVLCG